ncbi:MAG TPA: hypothetical protein VGB06_05785, partial [Solirubrobacterales bacterium]
MSLKLKVLGLGLLAVMATSAFVVTNASAVVSGHFVSENATHTILSGTGTATHSTHFSVDGGTGLICTSESYSGTINVATTQSVTIAPSYSKCHTTNT